MIKKLTAGLCLILVILISVGFFVSLMDRSRPTVLYTDLTSGEIYVKSGFEPAYATIRDPQITDWAVVLPAGEQVRNLSIASLGSTQLLNKHYSPWYPWRDRLPDQYTIFIPFEFTAAQINALYDQQQALSPGIYLAGIGDNWEIYLNGEAVISQVHLDQQGQIISHRNQRDVSFPVDRRLLQEGTNRLVIHVYGVSSDSYTGLFYTNPYYLGDYDQIVHRGDSFLTIAFCTAYIILGLYHALLYLLRKRDRHNLMYALFSVLVAVYFFARSSAIYTLTNNTAITQRIEYASLYFLVFALAVFLEVLAAPRISKVTWAYGVFCLVLVGASCVGSVFFANKLLSIWQVVGMLFLFYTFVVDVAWTFGKQIKQRLRKARAENVRLRISTVIFDGLRDTLIGNILIFFVVCILTSVFDLLDASVYHTGIVLTRYTFFLLSMAMAFILARSYASSFEATAQLNELLDTTVRQRTSQLEEQVLIAEAASRSKGDFLANMSHEIRTPLNAVIGMTDIGERAEDIERKDYAFMRIKQASQHLLGVINDILDMSKIEAGKLEISEAGFSIRDAVIRVENVMRFRTDEKRQNLIVTVADEVPQAVFGDDLRLAQVMTNLVGNAVKFTPENGTISLQVSLVSQVDNIVTLQFLVIDNGIGLTEEQLPHLFNAFQQADAGTVRKYGGTGLGLALSKQIVELMNGDIWVESEFGKGSTFGFTIKAALSENPVKETAVFAEELKADEFLGKTLMLAEDIEVNREIVHALLEISGLKIIDAVDGQEAVELFAAEPSRFDFILMDVQMPVMDGYQATLNIRALKDPHATEIPIVAMTANVFREDIERSLAAGMDAHLGKPIDLNAVVALLRQYLK